jgi:hypothetical protein
MHELIYNDNIFNYKTIKIHKTILAIYSRLIKVSNIYELLMFQIRNMTNIANQD